jgi:DNA-directed RNA polymerase subunit RPC12/RpoP
MSLKEQIAYLKGLTEGLDINAESKEGKVILAIIDTLEIMKDEIEDLVESSMEISDEIDAISEDLADVEQFVFDDDDDGDDFYDYDDYDDDDDDFDDDDDDDGFENDDDDDFEETGNGDCYCNLCDDKDITFDVQCPACGVEIELDENDLALDGINCPKCNEHLEFEFEDDDEAEASAEEIPTDNSGDNFAE